MSLWPVKAKLLKRLFTRLNLSPQETKKHSNTVQNGHLMCLLKVKAFPFKSNVPLQVKCLILFIYCLYVSSVCVMTLWHHWFWYREGKGRNLPAHTPVHWLALLDLTYKKALKAYLSSILMSAGTSQWNPLHNPICSGFHHLLAWTHWGILAALAELAAGEINLLGENHWSTGICRELQRPERADLHLAVVLSGF